MMRGRAWNLFAPKKRLEYLSCNDIQHYNSKLIAVTLDLRVLLLHILLLLAQMLVYIASCLCLHQHQYSMKRYPIKKEIVAELLLDCRGYTTTNGR